MADQKPTAKDLRDWMRENGRGYAAVAAHFALPGGETEARAICQIKPSEKGEPKPKGEPRARARAHVEDPPPQVPAVLTPEVPPVLSELSTRLVWVRAKMAETERFLDGAPAHAAAALLRVASDFKQQEADLLVKMREEDESKLSEEDAVEVAREAARELPDLILEIFVSEYLVRHRLVLGPAHV